MALTEERRQLIRAQLVYTARLIADALQLDLNLSDDGCDYLTGALKLSHALTVEFSEGIPFVDKAMMREFPGDSLCAELRQLVGSYGGSEPPLLR